MLPASLSATGRPGRGVPDVAGNADNASGYVILADGSWQTVGGTSAVAPLYAGLMALVNQALGHPVGPLLPELYAIPAAAGALSDITLGGQLGAGQPVRPGHRRLSGDPRVGRAHGPREHQRIRAAPAAAAGQPSTASAGRGGSGVSVSG
jgi:hypothetical protein